MTEIKKGLGTRTNDLALSELLSDFEEPVPSSSNEYRHLSVNVLQPGKYQPREDMNFEALQELADSIKARGIIQPIVVRPKGEGFEIIAGERRWRAAQLAGLSEVPVLVRDLTDEAVSAMSLIENIQRENLNALEEAKALKRLVDDFGMTHEEAAATIGRGRSRAYVSNLIRLLMLSDPVKQLLGHGDLEMGHARALLSLPEAQQIELAERIVSQGLSVRDTETAVKTYLSSADVSLTPQAPGKYVDPDILRLEEQMSNRLAAKVKLKHSQKGTGRLEIHYRNLEELDRLLEYFQGAY